jgi:TetR/AcrR family transcriptional regulator, transcriptional repressor for nem operon
MVGMRQFDEEQVLAQVLDVFWRKGFGATSMLDLAEATAVQRGSLYNAYRSKEKLFLLAFDRYAAGVLDSARASLASPDISKALHDFFESVIVHWGTPSRGCLTSKTAVEGDGIDGPIRQRLQRILSELEAIVREALSKEEVRGRLTLEPQEAAQVIVTFTRGLAVMERLYRNNRQLRSTAAALVRALVKPEAPTAKSA